jgi:hypothetical protein
MPELLQTVCELVPEADDKLIRPQVAPIVTVTVILHVTVLPPFLTLKTSRKVPAEPPGFIVMLEVAPPPDAMVALAPELVKVQDCAEYPEGGVPV